VARFETKAHSFKAKVLELSVLGGIVRPGRRVGQV
jgi:hypothetical protein